VAGDLQSSAIFFEVKMDEQEEEFIERTRNMINILHPIILKESLSVGMNAIQTILIGNAIQFGIDKELFITQLREHFEDTIELHKTRQINQFLNQSLTDVQKTIAIQNN
jgi:hypothetical protein